MLKHYKKTNRQHSKSFGDVTINDFANAVVCSNRPKKSTNNVVKQESEKAWDEIADDENFDYVREMNEDGTYILVLRQQCQQIKKSDKEPVDNVQMFNSHPLDIWYLISEHIRPQDVGIFAGICKASYAVVCSAKFWFTLYKRFYKYSSCLPIHLQRDHMVRLYGLRTSVIRALYFMYPPFANRLKSVRQCMRHPATLVKKQCVTAFYKQGIELLYCFKFKEYMRSLKQVPCKQNVIDVLEDVTANPDENCYILLISSKRLIPIPCVEGLILKSALLTLSQGFCYQRLQLEFSSQMHNYSGRTSGGSDHTSIVFDHVTGVKIIDWWDPQYPYNHNLKYSLMDKDEEEEDELSNNYESLFSMI
uniref:Transmembrane protein 183 n=1 Tax=Photinus pyralis TaxID=7054 RepID=A0A1Y1MMQ5_PHOPY